jgi:DNA-binding MarR family transcriptional regulator
MDNEDAVARIQRQWSVERPDLDTAPLAIIGRLHRLADRIRKELIGLYGRFGLGEGEFDILATLRRHGAPFEMAPGALAQRTMVTTGAVSKRLDRLEEAGLVERRPSEADGRARVVALTEAGRSLIDDAFTAHIRNEHRLIAGLDPQARADLERHLTTWMRELDA